MTGAIIRITHNLEKEAGTATLYLSADDVQAFHLLQKNYPDIAILIEAGVFDFKNGCAIIHRDKDGILRKVEVNQTKFRI